MEEKRLGYYFKIMANEMIRNRNRDLEKIGLTSTQADVLMFLLKHEEEEINQRDIEQFFGLSNPTVSGIINRLESKGFIERQSSSKDARYKRIVPTEESKKHVHDMHEKMQELEHQLLKGVTDEELQAFRTVAKKLHDNILDSIRKEKENERDI